MDNKIVRFLWFRVKNKTPGKYIQQMNITLAQQSNSLSDSNNSCQSFSQNAWCWKFNTCLRKICMEPPSQNIAASQVQRLSTAKMNK